MKTTFLLITLAFLFSIGTGVLAQETELPDPGLSPDSPFYFLETIIEEIGTFFTFGDLKKAERYADLAAERLAEAQAVAEKEKPELAEKTLARYQRQLGKSITRAERAESKGKNAEEVMAKVGQATSKHLEVLAEVYEKVPEQAKTAVENAMKASLKGHSRAVEVLKAKNALGKVPEEVSLPAKVPQEVKERVRMRAQQELEIEKTLESIDSSKSLRDICAEQGGTPEMCEEFPLEKFKSFEQIEAFCTEKGGPPEMCASLEDKCREFGVTEANKCFILLSTASIKTYQSAELKTSPQPLSPKQSEQIRVQREVVEDIPSEAEEELKQSYIPRPSISKAIIYLTSSCPHCVQAIRWFQENNIDYEVFDVSQDEEKQNELVGKIGRVVVPVIEAGNEMIVGFNEEKFSELFGVK